MEQTNIKVGILPNQFLKSDGTFDKDEAIKLSGQIAGICYDKEGYEHLKNEPIEKTNRRINMTLNNGHHSVYDHITINFNLQNVPKALAMVLNNEHQYTTSEKSARYTPVEPQEGSIITDKEVELYNKWLEIFKIKIKEQYGNVYNDNKITKLAQENARYLVTVFMPTQMVYSTSLRQINYIASWMKDYIEKNLSNSMKELLDELEKANVLEEGLMKNEKERELSLFGKDLDSKRSQYGDVYQTIYSGSLAQLAQAQRHRTIDYQMQFLPEEDKRYFIPPIIADDNSLVYEWYKDMQSVEAVTPQGELVLISESGKYDDFILKCKERLCSAAQLEIMLQTKNTLETYKNALETIGSPLATDIEKYSHGARCTFPDFTCTSDCGFKEGKLLQRKI